MRITHLLSATALASLGFAAMPAAAQQTPQSTDTTSATNTTAEASNQGAQDKAAAKPDSDIVVTGSRIVAPNLTSVTPVTSVTLQDLPTGNISLGDTLNRLPALRSTYSQSNSTRFIGTSGLSLLDLRGQGPARTLVLVDGRRHVTAQPGVNSVDVNTIPTDLIERVDIVTGGNSAVYGSDAVAGVVNFVLKKDFDGIRARAQSGISDHGDRPSYFGSIVAGKNFADGRGNISLAAEYAKTDALYYTQRDDQYGAFSGRHQFNVVENTIGEPAAGNGFPDNAFFTGVKNNNISNGGLLSSICPVAVATTAANYAIVNARRIQNCTGGRSNTGGELGRAYLFDSSGNFIANPITYDFRPFGSSNAIGGLGSTLLETSQLDPGLERAAFNLLAHFDFSPAFRPFVEAKYVRINSEQAGQPTFFNNTFSSANPYLTPANLALLRQVQGVPTGAFNFTAQRFNVDFGGRGEQHNRDTYRIVGGVQGTFNEDWRYEVSANYGRTDTFYRTQGNVNTVKYANSINAVRNAAGQIVCGINADTVTTNDDPACVPINLFGDGIAAQQPAALAYFVVPSSRRQRATQLDITGYVSGDSSQLFELPGGPVYFSLGGEFRRETAFSAYDALTKSGVTFLNVINDFRPPVLKVTEGFGELRFPLLKDVRFARELTIEAAGRVSHYNVGRTGTVFTYNVGGTYAPIHDVRFRVGYAKSVRAPTQSDLFASSSQTFLNGLVDPCSQTNINNNPNRVKNCAAAGVPTTEIDPATGARIPFTNVPASGISGFNGGNTALSQEKGTSLTAGVIIEPSMVRGLSLTVDYYRIKIANVISTLAGQTLINQCYDNPSGIDNPYCASIFRRADGTFAGQQNKITGGVTYTLPITGSSFNAGPFNFAKQETSGIDANLAYRRDLGSIKLNVLSVVTYTLSKNNYTDITNPNFIDRQLSELGDPQWAGSLTVGLDFGAFDLNYNLRYIGQQTIGTYEAQHSFNGLPPQNADQYPQINYPSITYSNIRLGVEANDKFRFYFGVDNAFNRLPPFGLDGTGFGSGIYENIGRFFYAGVEAKF